MLAQPLQTPFASRPDQLPAGVFDELAKRLHQSSPVPLRPTVLQPFRSAHFKDGPGGPSQPLFQQLSRETRRRRSFFVRRPVRLVDDQDQILNLPRHSLDEGQFLARQRRVCAHHNECRIDVGYESLGRSRVAREHRSQPGRIHQAHA